MSRRDDIWAEIQEQFSRQLVSVFSRGPEDLDRAQGEAREFAARLIKTLCDSIGGQELYVPRLPWCLRDARDQQVVFEFDGGNYKDLGRRFKITPRQTRRIIHGPKTK